VNLNHPLLELRLVLVLLQVLQALEVVLPVVLVFSQKQVLLGALQALEVVQPEVHHQLEVILVLGVN
jgi:hypothetical protein